jgi:ParB family chromosome partitioning protein
LVKNYQESLKPKSVTKANKVVFKVKEEEQKVMAEYFGAKIEVKIAGNGKGKISIPFHSEEDFNRIVKLMKG